jgi:hypothetical protein
MSAKFQVKETELYPVYDYSFALIDGISYEVEVEDGLEQEYFDALSTFENVLDRMESAIAGQIDQQKHKNKGETCQKKL